MRLFAAILSTVLLMGLTSSSWPRCLAAAGPTDLAFALGGACEICATDNSVTCTGTTCTKISDGNYEKKTGTGITPQKCAPAPSGPKTGYTKCTLTDKMPCFTYRRCTDIEVDYCENCSPKAAPKDNDKPTKCSTSGGYRCDG